MNIEEIKNRFESLKKEYFKTQDEVELFLDENKKVLKAIKIKNKIRNMYLIFPIISVTALLFALAYAFSGMILPAILLSAGGILNHMFEPKMEKAILKYIDINILKAELMSKTVVELDGLYKKNHAFIDFDLEQLDKIKTQVVYLFEHFLEVYPIIHDNLKLSGSLVESIQKFLNPEEEPETSKGHARTFTREGINKK